MVEKQYGAEFTFELAATFDKGELDSHFLISSIYRGNVSEGNHPKLKKEI